LVVIGGGLFRRPRRIPYHLATEMAPIGELRDAAWLASHGLVDRVADEGKALEEAFALADKIMINGPTALVAPKEIMFMSYEWAEDEV
jgi:enoyl-CoA hydratase